MNKAIIKDIVKKENVKKVIKVDKNRFLRNDDLSFFQKLFSKVYSQTKRSKENLIKDIRYILDYVASKKSKFIVLEILNENYLFVKN